MQCELCLKAKFHYAIWFEAGSKLVADQLRTSFEPDIVMEFGFYTVCGGEGADQRLSMNECDAMRRSLRRFSELSPTSERPSERASTRQATSTQL